MDCNQLTQDVVAQSNKYVQTFCELMGYTQDGHKPEVYFIGNDPFGIVYIDDEYWKMTDIFYFLSEYDKWKEKYGDRLIKTVFDWYWYSLEVHERSWREEETLQWVRVEDRMPKECERVVVINGKKDTDIAWWAIGGWRGTWVKDITHWKSASFPAPQKEYPTNLQHWLMGWRPNHMSTAEYEEYQKQKAKESYERLQKTKKDLEECI